MRSCPWYRRSFSCQSHRGYAPCITLPCPESALVGTYQPHNLQGQLQRSQSTEVARRDLAPQAIHAQHKFVTLHLQQTPLAPLIAEPCDFTQSALFTIGLLQAAQGRVARAECLLQMPASPVEELILARAMRVGHGRDQ